MAVLTARKKILPKRQFLMSFEEFRKQREPKPMRLMPRTPQERNLVKFKRVQNIVFKRIEQGLPVPKKWIETYFSLKVRLNLPSSLREKQLESKFSKKVA